MIILEVVEKNGRKIILTQDRWKHIATRHPELANDLEIIRRTMFAPAFIIQDSLDKNVYYYHTFSKEIEFYLIVAIKYLNLEGFVITAFYSKAKKK